MSDEIPWVSARPTPNRDDKYMGLAIVVASFSKDPYTQMGAAIVTPDNTPRSTGYNGPPKKINDNSFNWNRKAGKNDLMDHAEENAIEYAKGSVKGCHLYVTGFPCKSCMKLIVRKRIARVIYLERPYDSGSMQANMESFNRSMEIADLGGVIVEKYMGSVSWLPQWINHIIEQGIFPI